MRSQSVRVRGGFSLLDLVLSILVSGGCLLAAMRQAAEGGLVEIQADEIAVVVDYWSGEERVVETPGYISTLPYFQQVFRLRRRPSTYKMKGKDPVDQLTVDRLLVRANDGSSFWFGSFTLQYTLIPGEASHVLHNSEVLAARLKASPAQPDAEEGEEELQSLSRPMLVGAENVHAVARSILRDEFGRFSAEEVVLPQNLTGATQEAKRRLNELLEPHGVRIVQIATPKPQFDRKYESMIERRKVANQDMERLREKLGSIDEERNYLLSKVEKEMRIARERLRGKLRRQVNQARQLDIRTRKEADLFYSEKTAEAEALRSRKLQLAEAFVSRFDREAGTLMANAEALGEDGAGSVRAALVKRLSSIKFRFVPYSRDPVVERVELTDTKTTAKWSAR